MDERTLPHRSLRAAATATACALLAVLACTPLTASQPLGPVAARPAPAASETPAAGGWPAVEQLVADQRFQEALDLVQGLETAARAAGDEPAWTRALVEEVKLTLALHGYETGVRRLRDAAWPRAPRLRAVLGLYYAEALADYLRAYSWEIRERERVAGAQSGVDAEVDLKAWTAEQIYAEAQRAFQELWRQREAWGAEPLGELAVYFDQNNYPPRIRGTLRDAVTYLWAELLADSSLWSPAQDQEVYRLDLAALIAGGGGAEPGAELAGAAVHPLARRAAALGDLEAWHRAGGRPEAAFEARRDRLAGLWEAYPRAEDRRAIQADLEESLDAALGRRYEWWSFGMATLAEWVSGGEGPGALVRAREIALAGERAHPGSVGGQLCRSRIAGIEAPEYGVMAMATDGPGRRSLAVTHKNLERLYFRVYRLDLRRQIEQAQDWNLLPAGDEVARIVDARRADAAWTAELPPTPDFRDHRTYVTPPLAGPGAYLVVASARSDFAAAGNRRVAVNLIVSDLVLLTRQDGTAYEVTVRSGASGAALAGVAVDLYRYDWHGGHGRASTLTSGADGRVRFATADWSPDERRFVLARRGDDVAFTAQPLHRLETRREEPATAALVYTDRSVYRPAQAIFWKAVAFRGGGDGGDGDDEGRFATLPRSALTVELIDPDGEVVATAEATTNAFGSASGSFAVPSGRLLGGWLLRCSLGGESSIRVEEYKRPTFEVAIADPAEPLRLNRPAALTGEARYYFGLPVAAGTVSWRVTREPVVAPWWRWGRGWSPAPEATIAAGTAALAADGTFPVVFTPAADEREAATPGLSYRYRLAADVTDEGGETRSAARAFRLGFVAVEATIEGEAAFVRAGEPARFTLRRRDLDGTPRAGAGEWRLVALAQPAAALTPADQPLPAPAPVEAADGVTDGGPGGPWGPGPYRTAGDGLRPRWEPNYQPAEVLKLWPDGAELRRGALEPEAHGTDGAAELALGPLPAGAYRLHYATRDDFGATFETAEEFVVAAPGATPLALPAILLAEQGSVEVGGTARLLVHSGLPDQPLLLEIFRGGRRVERRDLPSKAGAQVLEIPVASRDRGGFSVTLTAVADHQFIHLTTDVFVPWSDRELAVEFATFRDRLRPGAKESWRVTVKAAGGEGGDGTAVARGAAEVLATMYDRSLDLFAPHDPPDPLAIYPRRTGVPWTWSNLGATYPAWTWDRDFAPVPAPPGLYGDSLKLYGGYGIGGLGRRRGFAYAQQIPAPMAMRVAEKVGVSMAAGNEADAVQVAEEITVAAAAPEAQLAEALRTEFAETAFWQPHLLTGDDGAVSFEFTVPDSVTEWSVWAHAVTRDLRAGSVERRTRSVKELLVRPYLPRFLREGDRAEIRVVVQNAGDVPLTGTLDFAVEDPDTGASLLAEFGLAAERATGVPFTVAPGAGATLTFPLTAPHRVGAVAVRAVARAGAWSDGELRPLPLLPGRVHLAQSRFAALHDADRRTLTFAGLAAQADPATADPTLIHDQLVVTVDGQLFYGVLNALPYLVEYPYECTEQTLNRFVSTGIVASLYDRYPAVARMAKELSARETRLPPWQAADPNRKMALEETPWLAESRGGGRGQDPDQALINVLDPKIAAAQRAAALAELEKAQTSLGAFPWWPGGPPSPYMTLYLLDGFSRALEFEVEVPKEMVVGAWSYLHGYYVDEVWRTMVKDDCCWEVVTYLNYVLSNYPQAPDESWTGGVFNDDDRHKMLEFSFRHWREHSPRLKAYLALTLNRAGRGDDARLVFASVLDSAKTDPDLGTYWAPEDRAWLWYNDTVESHAFALRALTELAPDDARRHGLVQWLFLDRKLGHWKSTRATAEAIYALVHYLEKEGTLGAREEATVSVGPRSERFVFAPDRYTGGGNQIVVSGPEVDPATMASVVVEKATPGLLFASATWHFSTERTPAAGDGDGGLLRVERTYFKRERRGTEAVLVPLADGAPVAPGDEVEVHLSLTARHAAEYVHLRDPRGAGFEPASLTSGYRWDLGIVWYEAVRDSGADFFFEWLPAGEYTFKVRLRANLAGTFKVGPATVQSMYAPEFTGYSAGAVLAVLAATSAPPAAD